MANFNFVAKIFLERSEQVDGIPEIFCKYFIQFICTHKFAELSL
jgi:hypothetical protein